MTVVAAEPEVDPPNRPDQPDRSVRADRWQPSRAGLVGLWRYWDETFTFHRGRLLLRGPNGSGKSMALELLLPFLLDGDTAPSRLTSAARPRGRLFDRVMTGSSEPSRVGFAWVEFVRGHELFTVGARIRASQATGKADVDLFTTTRAVGTDLHLLDATRTPLSRKGLAEAIGDSGRIHESAEAHRNAVREVLFPGFGADRYESVINALLALRKEKLSHNLDLDKLSAVLSDALPPLDDHDLAAVAEGFERLDRRKAELAALEGDMDQIEGLARLQRSYALAVVAGAAAEVRRAETERDEVTRGERQAREELDGAQARSTQVGAERQQAEERREAIRTEVAALKESEAYRQGTNLVDLRSQARQLRDVADRAADRALRLADARNVAAAELEGAREGERAARANEELAVRDLGVAADESDARGVLAEALAGGSSDPDEGERLLETWVRARRDRVGEVRVALDDYDRAVVRRQHLDQQFEVDRSVVEERSESRVQAAAGIGAARSAYAQSVRAWVAASSQLGGEGLLSMLPDPPDDPDGVEAALAAAVAVARTADARARQALDTDRAGARQEQSALRAERQRWEGDGLVDPDGPAWRSGRSGRSGAPLWRLVDVADGTTDRDVDGLEAALTAAGLVDAWVRPDGAVEIGDDMADVLLGVRRVTGRDLSSALVPAAATADGPVVPAQVVAGVLASIQVVDTVVAVTSSPAGSESGVGGSDSAGEAGAPGEVTLATDGSFRLGSAVGRGPLRPARLLGAVARERRRQERLAELDAALAAAAARLMELDRWEATLDRRWAALDAELEAKPSGRSVESAVRAEADAAARLGEASDRLERTRKARHQAEEDVRQGLRSLTALAALHGLPAERDQLLRVESGLDRLLGTTRTWARRRRDTLAAAREAGRSAARELGAREVAESAAADCEDAERDARDLEWKVTSLESSVGAEFAQLARRIDDLGGEERATAARIRELGAESDGLLRRLGDLEARVAAAASARQGAEARRERTQRTLVAAHASLGVDAGLDVSLGLDSATAVLAAARAMASSHPTVDVSAQALTRMNERVAERMHVAQVALGGRVALDRELVEGSWWILRTTANGLHRRVSELAVALSTALAQGRAELADEEERLFEQTLAGSVRRALADRIRQANRLTDAINRQLGAVRTAAGGVQVRLRWEVADDQPPAVKAARALLLRDPADLADAERTSLQEFVRARVDQARADLDATAPWEERLHETLDYRSWHHFQLQLAHRDWDGFVPATPRRLQKLSTGERSIALHLPMIASVAAHYSEQGEARSGCPRLILLDELFAGVDGANRAQLFGTFATWDLDAVFTSDHEWCQYETLDGIAIHYLHPPVGDDPVTSTRFTWDGRRRRIDQPDEPAA